MAASRVAIIGAGLAGLSAALELKDAGHTVDLYERSRLFGGRATSFVVAGHEVDNGQHVFLACCDAFIAFVRRLDMADALFLQERFDAVIYRHGRRARLRAAALPPPWHLALGFLGYAHLGIAARLSVARALRDVRSASSFDGSFAAWLAARRQPAEALRAFWEPFVVPALNAPLDHVSAVDAAFVLETAFLSDANAARFGWCRVPLAHIAEAAARRLDAVYLATPIVRVQTSGEGIVLRTLGGGGVTYDAAVLAVPPPQLARMLGDEATALGLSSLDSYEPYPIVDVHLWYTGADVDFTFAALLDSPVQWVFRKGEGYLCCSVSAAGDMLAAPTDDVVARCWDAMQVSVPALASATLRDSAVTRNPTATFLPRVGTRRPAAATSHPCVTIAGSWTATGWPDTMESAVRSGSSAARALTQALDRSRGGGGLPTSA